MARLLQVWTRVLISFMDSSSFCKGIWLLYSIRKEGYFINNWGFRRLDIFMIMMVMAISSGPFLGLVFDGFPKRASWFIVALSGASWCSMVHYGIISASLAHCWACLGAFYGLLGASSIFASGQIPQYNIVQSSKHSDIVQSSKCHIVTSLHRHITILTHRPIITSTNHPIFESPNHPITQSYNHQIIQSSNSQIVQ